MKLVCSLDNSCARRVALATPGSLFRWQIRNTYRPRTRPSMAKREPELPAGAAPAKNYFKSSEATGLAPNHRCGQLRMQPHNGARSGTAKQLPRSSDQLVL
jgi:hypothetical protein